VKEEDIRPKKIFDEYLRLAAQDAKTYFSGVAREYISCPACGNRGEFAFEKFDFNYDQCPKCHTLFVNPRPESNAFERYYQESASSRYWASTFYKETSESRREKLWKPKAIEINKILREIDADRSSTIVDIGGGYGIFAEEMQKLAANPSIVIEPSPHLAEICRGKGLLVVEKFLEHVSRDDFDDGPKVFASFELFEHLHNPSHFLQCLQEIMSSGDLFIFTTLSGMGLDIQVLWQDSKSVMPPHHLNFFNPKSIEAVLRGNGFKVIKITTPGQLDLDILDNNLNLIKDRFWKSFLTQASASEKSSLQKWVADQGYSSHMWAICEKI